MDRGCWPAFVHYREELIAKGDKPVVANKAALLKYLGKPVDGFANDQVVTPEPSSPDAVSGDIPTVLVPSPTFSGPLSKVKKVVVMADFAGKQAGTAECIRWVARHMDLEDVTAADCPDSMAWSMLMECRRTPLFRFEFYKSVLPRTIEKGDVGDRGEGDEEVARQVEVIERLLVARDAAKVARESEVKA